MSTSATAYDNAESSRAKRGIVECPAQDDRDYGTLELDNGMQVLLISDATTDKASAALDVRVGHLSDPAEIPGLAHFLEHMLFMGTEKYPDENSYNVYLNSNGGSSNAFTDMESTNYYFDVAADEFEGALDRFAQFFIAPLFTPSATDREMNAVDSEHAKNLQNDFWRLFQLSKSLCRPDHPFSKFGSGNLQTLQEGPTEAGLNIRDSLLRFHEQYYSANLMKLVVLGKESVEELEQMVTQYFSMVPNKSLPRPEFPGTPFGPEQLGKRLHVVPVREARSLELHFPMREVDSLYLQKPNRYISHLIGHEGSGSLLSLLKELGWANELSAGDSRTCSDWSAFVISIDLTDAGLEQVEDVTEVVFSYLSLLKTVGPQEWIHEETSTVADCSFRFLSKRNPIDYTCSLAGHMQLYAQEHIVSGPYRIYKYDPDRIIECLSYLRPDNMIMIILARKFSGSTTLKEKWYGTEHSIEAISEDDAKRWEAATVDSTLVNGKLRLPEKNDMIATDFTLRKVEGVPKDEPRLLMDTDVCRLWYKPDNVFDMPKVNIVAEIVTPTAFDSPEASVLSFLYVQILQEHCNEFSYLASMASLHCSFVNARTGIEINVSGYSHKANVLLGRIIDSMLAFPDKVTDELFERIKDKASKQYHNFLFSPPYHHAFYGGDLCLETGKWSMEDKISALSGISKPDLVEFSRRLLSRFHLEALIHGNCSPEEATALVSTILDGLTPSPPFASNDPALRVVELACGQEYVYRFPESNEEETNSCIENLYQVGPVDIATNSVMALLHHLVKEPAFNELRSEEQLGYIVHTSIKTHGTDIKGLLFLVQSDSFDPIHVDGRIEAFLVRFRSKLVDMSPEEFQTNVSAVMKNFLEKNKSLGEESTKHWAAISNKSYLFKKYQLVAAEVEKIELTTVLRFFDKFIAKNAPNRRKLSIQVYSKKHIEKMDEPVPKETGVTLIRATDVIEFKRNMPLFSLPPKVNVENMKLEK